MKPQALLLDFYGTLVTDDTPAITSICHALSTTATTPADVGVYWSAFFTRLCAEATGTTFVLQRKLAHESLQATVSRYRSSADPADLSDILVSYWRQPALCPDAQSFLTTVGLPVCLVSNTDEDVLTAALEHVGLQFDHIVTSERARAYKPRPEPFTLALERLDLAADQVVHIGDSRTSDVAGAQAAGIRALWLDRHGRGGLAGLEEVRRVLG